MNTNLASALLIALCVHLGASQSRGFASLGGMPLGLQSLQEARGLTTNTFPGSLSGNFPGTFKSASNTNKDFWPGPSAYSPMPMENTIYPDLSALLMLQKLKHLQPRQQQRRTNMHQAWPLFLGMEDDMWPITMLAMQNA